MANYQDMQIIIPHTNTDLDALGAAVGARLLYPKAVIVLPGAPGAQAAEFISLHRYSLRFRNVREIDLRAVTRSIVVDTADPARLGALRETAMQTEVHLYDHHPPEAGDLEGALEVRDLVGATSTLVAELIEESGASPSPLEATVLLLGIYADTGSLSLTGTTARDARAAAFLLERGANLRVMARFIQRALTPLQHALLQQLLGSDRWLNVKGARIRIVTGETPAYVGGLALVVHRLSELQPAPAFFAVVRMADRVHLVGRSEVPWVDAARVMAHFGGGGHPGAASAVVRSASVADLLSRLEAVLEVVVEEPLLAHSVMSRPVKSVTAEKPIREAERIMLRHGHSGLPVVDQVGRLEGVISLRDVEKARRHDLEHAPVKGIMVRRVVTVPPDMPVDQIQDLMVERDIGRVPVVEAGNLVGIVSRSDLLSLLYGGAAPSWNGRPRAAFSGGAGPAEAPDLHAAMRRLPTPVRSLLRSGGILSERLETPVFAVGGFVRDLLLGRENLDLDLVVEGDAIAFARNWARRLKARVKEVPRFAAAHIYLKRSRTGTPTHIDIATARREFYEHAAALPLVEHADLREDLYRRDFTINAMAMRLGGAGPQGIIDFFGGLRDLQDGQIRVLHSLSFVEDPTRIIRAVRFARRYGFSLEDETRKAAEGAAREGYIGRLSAERLRNELVLILEESGSAGALALLEQIGALDQILPGVELSEGARALLDRVDHLSDEVEDLMAASRPWLLKLLCLLHAAPLPRALAAVRRLRFRRLHAASLQQGLESWQEALDSIRAPAATPAEVVRALAAQPPETVLLLHMLGGGPAVVNYWREWRHIRLAITGADLLGMGRPAGPWVGRVLERVRADCLNGLAPDRAAQFARARWYVGEEA